MTRINLGLANRSKFFQRWFANALIALVTVIVLTLVLLAVMW